MSKKITISKSSFFEDLITKQHFLTQPDAPFLWDEMVAEKENIKKIKREKDSDVFFAYIESRFAYAYAKLFNAKLMERNVNASDEEHSEVKKILAYFISDDISRHSSQVSQINAFRRWIDTAFILRKMHNYEGYFLVRDTLMEMEEELQLTQNKAFKSHLKMYNQLVQINATLIDEQLKTDYSRIPLQDFANPDGFAKRGKAGPRLKTFFEGREYIESCLEREIMGAQGGNQIKMFCKWIDIAIDLRKKHNYEGYFLVITNLQLIDRVIKAGDLSQSYLKKYNQLLAHASPFDNFGKLRKLWGNDNSPDKLISTFYWTKELANLNEKMEQQEGNEDILVLMLREKNRKLALIAKEQQSFAGRVVSYSTKIPKHLESEFATIEKQYNNNKEEVARAKFLNTRGA
ncbi:RasGEF domain [Legionella steigerwaltii]|uniref:RasGEF domain n=1 Tax=Legionella steigerwaltii TaxID=460 RepID=A0A378L8V5_9GAMM|nr:RasGEF domain-containing protein [Legionella steigerwaltii]KTD81036.1 RasGEF domain protein [Legionella steigerwaltii]STY23276.1 RasGEF domain [Legionella steigerwaltii]